VYLSLREMRHSRLRTAMIVAIIALIAWLVFLLSGLANGLSNDNGASLRKMDATGIVFQRDVRMFLHRSLLPAEAVRQVAAVEGVTAATPIGHLTVTVMGADGTDRVDATILAVDPAGFLAPSVTSGAALADAPEGGVVVDDEFKRHGYTIGDTLQVTPSGQRMTIAGFTGGQKYNHLPVIFMRIPQWQAIKFPTAEEAGGLADPISAVVVQGDGGALDRIASEVPNVEVGTMQDAIEALPGYSSEMGTVRTILVFLFLIAALVMAAFFYVITLQKTNQFGVLKAIGAKTRTLALDLVGQVVLLTLAGAAIGAVLANLVAAVIPADVPFYLSNGIVVAYGAVLVVVAAVGSLLSAARIAKVDPLIAIGRVD
jgi:putative ABC transport system permease protein